MDRITTLPDHLVALILEKLPVIDRVKTSILSRIWRFKWTLVSSLLLDYWFYLSTPRFSSYLPLEYANLINSLLLQHGGCLTKFDLHIPYKDPFDILLFQHSIINATRNRRLEELSVCGANIILTTYDFPSCIFSVGSLMDLNASLFCFSPPPWFEGFPNLTRFVLYSVTTTADTVNHFVSLCPKLKKVALEGLCFVNGEEELDLSVGDQNLEHKIHLTAPDLTHLNLHGNFLYVSVSNAQNLDSISLCSSSSFGVNSTRSEIVNLFKKSWQLEHICLMSYYCKFLGSDSAIEDLPRFDQMKSLQFRFVTFHDPDQLRCFLGFCAHSPNVRKLNLKFSGIASQIAEGVDPLELESMAEKYINKDLKDLVRVDMFDVSGHNIEMKIIELLLRFSPMLEVMHIYFDEGVNENAKLHLIEAGTNFYRASEKVKVHILSEPYAYLLEAVPFRRDPYFTYMA